MEASRDTNAQIVRYTCFIGARDKSNHLTVGSLQRSPGELEKTASSGKANDLRNREHDVLDLFSNLNSCKIQGFLWWASGIK